MIVRVLIAGKESPAQIDLTGKAEPTIEDLSDAIRASASVPPPRRLRLIVDGRAVSGRRLDSLNDAGIVDGSVVHCGIPDALTAPLSTGRNLDFGSSPSIERDANHHAIENDDLEIEPEEVPETSMSMLLRAPPVEFGQDAGPSIEEVHEMTGNWADWISGVLLGGGLGVIMLLLSTDKTISFSKHFKSGIKAGVVCNFLFGLAVLATDSDLFQ